MAVGTEGVGDGKASDLIDIRSAMGPLGQLWKKQLLEETDVSQLSSFAPSGTPLLQFRLNFEL